MSGKRESKTKGQPSSRQIWWARHKAWVAGMSRGQKIRYRLLQVLVVLAVIAVGAAVWLKATVKLPDIPVTPDSSGEADSSAYDGAELPDVAKSGRKDGVYTFLLVGQDTAGGGNTDTMILLTFDTKNKTIDGMSLPRDTMINSSHTGAGHRLNAVYNYNKGSDKSTQVEKGMAALKTEVSKLTGIVPDYYVLVQWEAVGELVEALGGVYFEVPFDMDYDDPTPGQDLHIHLKEGYQKLNGEQAMGLVRWRKNNTGSSGGDVARIAIQQDFLKAVASECLKPATLLKAPALAEVFMKNVSTDLSIGNILAFAQAANGMDADQGVNFVTMPWTNAYYPGVSMILPVVDELLEILNESFNPYLSDIQASDLQVLVRNSNGSYSVTGGTLLDSSLSSAKGSSSSGSSQSSDSNKNSGSSSGSSSGTTTKPEQPENNQPSTEPGDTETTTPDTSVTEPEDPTQDGGDSAQGGSDATQGSGSTQGGSDATQGGGSTQGGSDTTQGSGGTQGGGQPAADPQPSEGGQSDVTAQSGANETTQEPAGGELAA